ncbi:MAG: Hsp20/alpha crystallin family protein [Acidimicrobiia bacterium]
MALMRRSPNDIDWSRAFPFSRFADWPKWSELMDEELPRVEEFREGDTLVVRAEMPGMDPDNDVDISVSDHTLTLKAERRQETKTDEKRGYRSEFRYGAFTRTIELPPDATEEDVTATYRDGILEVRIPTSPDKATAKKISVTKS